MTIRWETIDVQGKPMRCYLATPDHKQPRPGVVIASQGRPGIDNSMYDVVHQLHREGYAAVLPDIFHRQPTDLPDGTRHSQLLIDEEVIADMNAAAALLKSQAVTVDPLGVIGFCIGGRVAYMMSAVNHAFRAAAVFYSGNIMKSMGAGPLPFERTKDIGCPLLGLFGADDVNPSPEDLRKIDAELTRFGKWHEFHIYQNTGHGFQTFLNLERYRERAARAAWGELLAFLDHFLVRRETAPEAAR